MAKIAIMADSAHATPQMPVTAAEWQRLLDAERAKRAAYEAHPSAETEEQEQSLARVVSEWDQAAIALCLAPVDQAPALALKFELLREEDRLGWNEADLIIDVMARDLARITA